MLAISFKYFDVFPNIVSICSAYWTHWEVCQPVQDPVAFRRQTVDGIAQLRKTDVHPFQELGVVPAFVVFPIFADDSSISSLVEMHPRRAEHRLEGARMIIDQAQQPVEIRRVVFAIRIPLFWRQEFHSQFKKKIQNQANPPGSK